jgi:hypothetical protein
MREILSQARRFNLVRVEFDEPFERSGIEVLPTLKTVIQFNGIEDWNKTAELHSNPVNAETGENSSEEGGNTP